MTYLINVMTSLINMHAQTRDRFFNMHAQTRDGVFNMHAQTRDGFFNMHAQTRDGFFNICLLYTSPSPRDRHASRMPSSA